MPCPLTLFCGNYNATGGTTVRWVTQRLPMPSPCLLLASSAPSNKPYFSLSPNRETKTEWPYNTHSHSPDSNFPYLLPAPAPSERSYQMMPYMRLTIAKLTRTEKLHLLVYYYYKVGLVDSNFWKHLNKKKRKKRKPGGTAIGLLR